MNNLAPYIEQPHDPIANLNLGLEYEQIGQTAAAVSFYIRAAEKTLNHKIQYIALSRAAMCFEKQGNRNLTVKTLLQRAISVLPTRPEAYFLLSRFYEYQKEYHDSYMIASIGLSYSEVSPNKLDEITEYPGKYGLLFQKAVSGWWVGLNEQSREIMWDLATNYNLNDLYKTIVQNNINNIGYPENKFVYTKSLSNEFKYKFDGLDKILTNYSQIYQDMFVLTVLNGKHNGTYLEIGSGEPFRKNNTALLENTFNWSGLSLEINEKEVEQFNNERKNKAICVNALTVDYEKLLTNENFEPVIDYLQVDCEPAETTFEILKKVISSGFKFRVITFEHDFYQNRTVKQLSRDYLTSQGYKLLVNDIGFTNNSIEDWWILPDYVTTHHFSEFPNTQMNFVEDIFYSENVYSINTIDSIVTKNPDLLTDKNKHWCYYSHSYFDNFYETEFKKYQNRPISLCEIGIYLGASFLVWNEYFHKDSKLLGIDIDNCVDPKYYEHNFNNVRYIFNDAYNLNIVNTLDKFDIIIDDGPHTIESQLDAIKLYLPKLNDGGVFIIEDIQQLSYIDILTAAVPDQYKSNIEVINLTEIDNRYDSLLFIIRKH